MIASESSGPGRSAGWFHGASRAGGFAVNLGLLALFSLALIPLLIESSGAAGWGAIALGQAIGLVASVAVTYGWGFHGPATIARSRQSPEAVCVEVLESVKLRVVLLPVVASVGGLMVWALDVSHGALGLAGFASMITLGLRMNWVFVGLRSPSLLFLCETLPRLIAMGISLVGLAVLGVDAATALYFVAIGNAASMFITLVWLRRVHRFNGLRLRGIWTLMRVHWHGVVGLITSALWATLPTYAVALLAPSALPSFALAMRVYAQANTASSPIIDVLQGWVPTCEARTTRRRALKALWISAAAATVGVGLYLLLAAPLFSLLGAGQVNVSWPDQLLVGIAIGLSVVVQTTNRACLSALGLSGRFTVITLVGTVGGVIVMLVAIPVLGATGGIIAIVASLALQGLLGVALVVWSARTSEPPRDI